MAEGNKKGSNTNSNSYMIVYLIIIIVFVIFLLAFVFQTLKPMQDANVVLDRKKQILNSLNIRDLNGGDAAARYREVVLADEIIDEQGNILEKREQDGENNGFKLNSADFKNGKLALFVCEANGQTRYVIPVYDMGLWETTNGYVTIGTDRSTVFGTYSDYDSEAVGLGVEIRGNRVWQSQFQGKKLLIQDPHRVALAVSKKMEDPSTRVDDITSATLISDGVTEILQICLGTCMNFLKAH